MALKALSIRPCCGLNGVMKRNLFFICSQMPNLFRSIYRPIIKNNIGGSKTPLILLIFKPAKLKKSATFLFLCFPFETSKAKSSFFKIIMLSVRKSVVDEDEWSLSVFFHQFLLAKLDIETMA